MVEYSVVSLDNVRVARKVEQTAEMLAADLAV